MAQNEIDYTQALADIKAGLQNVVPRVQTLGDKIVITQGNESITLPISPVVTSTNILK
jgi:hypothetical protein